VRHAEKAATPANDPPLTAKGEARARALATIARKDGVQAILTTQYLRTRETARPAAESLHITPEVVNAGGADHAREVARRIMQEHQGQVVLVVEHSNTIPAIVAALGAPEPPPICDNEYDGLYTVLIAPTRATTVMKSRYGATSPVTAECGTMMKR
jgi:broad specificity phosphatase PhoE